MLSICHHYYGKKKRMSHNSSCLSQDALMSGKKNASTTIFLTNLSLGVTRGRSFLPPRPPQSWDMGNKWLSTWLCCESSGFSKGPFTVTCLFIFPVSEHYKNKGQKNRGYANNSQVTIKSMQFQSLMQMIAEFLRKLREDTALLCEIA